MSKPVPIVVGVGQKTLRTESPDEWPDPIEATVDVVRAAAADAECMDLVAKADALQIVSFTAWSMKDPPSIFAEALGIDPALKELTTVGGNSPQWLANRAADNLAAGRSEIAILTGCEAWYTMWRARRIGKMQTEYVDKLEVPRVGITHRGHPPEGIDQGAITPADYFSLFDNAIRAKDGLSMEGQRKRLGEFGKTFSAVAAQNPYSWYKVARTAEEVVTPGGGNRMTAFPYTKYLNALPADMAAAVIMTTTEVASKLGIPEDKWVYIHGGQDVVDEWYVGHQPDLAECPSLGAMIDDALEQAKLGLDDIDFFDLYSCFPSMARIACRAMGLAEDDPRPLTVTGGLPYFGGPGNNYVMHSISETVNRCRANPDAFILVTGDGLQCSKHSAGIYGSRPAAQPWKRTPVEQFQEEVATPAPLEVDPEPTGPLRVDSYTVLHDREGQPEAGVLCGRTQEGKRAWARTPAGANEVLDAMMSEEWIGREGRIVRREGKVNVFEPS